jgi:hypothetical protein
VSARFRERNRQLRLDIQKNKQKSLSRPDILGFF